MGYMTVVSILNDGLDVIKKQPEEFVNNIECGVDGISADRKYRYSNNVNDYPVGNFANPMEVAKSFHADNPQIFYVGQNCMTMLTDWTASSKEDMEFQLERIKEAKKTLLVSERDLKEKLVSINNKIKEDK